MAKITQNVVKLALDKKFAREFFKYVILIEKEWRY